MFGMWHVQVRHRPGTLCLEALDTLAVVLLSEVGQAAVLEGFVNPVLAGSIVSPAREDTISESRVVASPPSHQRRTGGSREDLPTGAKQLMSSSSPSMILARDPPCQAALRESVGAMEQAGRWHALALMRAARNHADEALAIWQGMAEGRIQASVSYSI